MIKKLWGVPEHYLYYSNKVRRVDTNFSILNSTAQSRPLSHWGQDLVLTSDEMQRAGCSCVKGQGDIAQTQIWMWGLHWR